MINCIIVDDEPHAIELIASYVQKIPNIQMVFSSTNPIEAFQFLQSNSVQLVFLDIHMPELNGLQFLKLLGGRSKVILTTAYPEYALEGYELDVVDYLLKPILFERFFKAVSKAMNLLAIKDIDKLATIQNEQQEDDYIFVKADTKGKLLKIVLRDILFIEGLGNYVTIHTNNGKTICLITFKELEVKLPAEQFLRIHKSYIVRLASINMIEGNMVYLDKINLPIGESYKSILMERVSDKIINKGKGSIS